MPRDSLRLQAEEVFADPGWRQALRHDLSVRATDNAPGNPCRGLAGCVTTYQGIAAAPDLHLTAFRRHRYLLVVDEVHHLPELLETDAAGDRDGPPDVAAAWSAPIEPLLALSAVRLPLSGTLERADGRRILWLPYRRGTGGRQEVDLAAPGWAVIGYSRARALAERAVEDAAEGVSGAVVPPRGAGLYHAYNAALKHALGDKARNEMSLAELEAAAEWLGRNRLREHLHRMHPVNTAPLVNRRFLALAARFRLSVRPR